MADDEWDGLRASLTRLGKEWGTRFFGVSDFSVDQVLDQVRCHEPSVLLLDILDAGRERPGHPESGIRLFDELGKDKRWNDLRGRVQIVFFSAEPSVRRHNIVGRARRIDVSGFVSKNDLLEGNSEAVGILSQADKLARLYANCPELASPELRKLTELEFSPNSRVMHDVWRQIVLAGRCHEPIFISGETGTGKELVANAVFRICQAISDGRKGDRALGSSDFLPLNIAALPAEGNLQYIELFGAEPESYSGITKPRKGLFELAGEAGAKGGTTDKPSGGTVFLDEIGDAAPVVQVALLRVLQEKTITPLGGFNSTKANKKVSFRLISASHSLLENVERGVFRADLYYRLNGLHIHMPPLRERKGDIGVLVQKFLDGLNVEYGKVGWAPKDLGDAEKLVEKLTGYHWPGNVRELEMSIRSSYVTTIGNTFQISDEVERRIAGREASPKANIDQIIESLRLKPRHYTQLAKELGEDIAKDVYASIVIRFHGHLDDVTAQRYFGPDVKGGALRKWASRKGIGSPNRAKRAVIDRHGDTTREGEENNV